MTTPAYDEPRLTLSFGSGTDSSEQARVAMLTERMQRKSLPTYDEIVEAFPQFAGATSMFAAGSVVLGWGHGTSDIDLYVLMPELPECRDDFFVQSVSTSDPTIYVVLGQFGAFRADIEVWTTAQVDELVARFAGGPDAVHAPERSEQDLFYRLVSGRALHGETWWSTTRAAILASRYKSWLAARRLELAASQLERAEVMRAKKSSTGALIAARESLLCALEALLVYSDDFSVNRKWIFKRLDGERSGLIDPDHAKDLIRMPGAVEDTAGWVDRLIGESVKINTAVREWTER